MLVSLSSSQFVEVESTPSTVESLMFGKKQKSFFGLKVNMHEFFHFLVSTVESMQMLKIDKFKIWLPIGRTHFTDFVFLGELINLLVLVFM